MLNILLRSAPLKIFKTIEKTGSLSAAARELNMSYRAVWGKVRSTEQRLGVKLVSGVTGGPKHGGTTVTEKAKTFIKRFEEFDKKARKEVEELAKQLLDGAIDDLKKDN